MVPSLHKLFLKSSPGCHRISARIILFRILGTWQSWRDGWLSWRDGWLSWRDGKVGGKGGYTLAKLFGMAKLQGWVAKLLGMGGLVVKDVWLSW